MNICSEVDYTGLYRSLPSFLNRFRHRLIALFLITLHELFAASLNILLFLVSILHLMLNRTLFTTHSLCNRHISRPKVVSNSSSYNVLSITFTPLLWSLSGITGMR